MAWIDELFKFMVESGASDLHMSSQSQPMLRLHGDMVIIEDQPVIPPDTMRQYLYEILPERNRTQFEEEWDTDFAYALEGYGRFRCNYFMDRMGPGAVFRVIPTEILTAEQLNLPKAVVDLCYLTKGLVVVTGPTGSGKSTTLAAMIDLINKTRTDHIITIEDPIEFVHPNKKCLLNQREVSRHTTGFKRALRAALREDPDIILVGEMRDLETVEIAIETAETGHLVFGTLHTNTAASTVDRIIDQFPADRQSQIRTMLSASLKGVVAQTLCKKLPKGRIAALEILVVNSAVASNIRDGKTHQIPSAMQIGGRLGMKLLNDSLVELVQQEKVAPLEAYMKSIDKQDMQNKLQTAGHKIDLGAISKNAASAPKPQGLASSHASEAPAAPRPAAPVARPPAAAPVAKPVSPPVAKPVAPPAQKEKPKQGYVDPFDQFRQSHS